jgi:hypothetical protein
MTFGNPLTAGIKAVKLRGGKSGKAVEAAGLGILKVVNKEPFKTS